MIQVTHLNKYYNKGKRNEIHVINDTTLSLPDTGFVCILGESGSGKTTLLNTIGGLDDFKSGTISIGEETLSHYSSAHIDKLRTTHCAYVFQNYYLLSEHTVEYNLRLSLDMYTLSEEEKNARIDYVLAAIDMLKYKKRVVARLSGGQQQRVAIARALAKSPEVIFADEPTGNLDNTNTMRIMRILKKVSETCLVVMVTHERRLAEFFADRIIQVEAGRVIKDAPSEAEGSYRYYDDSVLYLKEYNETAFQNDRISLHCYSREADTPALTLRVIYENGRYYIQAPEDATVLFLQPDGDKQVADEARPELSSKEVQKEGFCLEKLPCRRMPRLPLTEIVRFAKRNLFQSGKQQLFLAASFLAMAVLLVLTVADILTISSLDIRSVVHNDSEYLHVSVERGAAITQSEYDELFNAMLDTFLTTVPVEDLQFDYRTDLSYVYDGFVQLKDVNGLFTGHYSLAPLERLSEDSLVAGRMPEAWNEIVIDTWVLDSFLSTDRILSNLIPTAEDFLGKELSIEKKNWTLTIVGISDSGQPDIYLDKFTRLSLSTWLGQSMAALSTLQEAFPNRFSSVELKEGEALISERFYEQRVLSKNTDSFSTPLSKTYQIVGTFPDEFPADAVIADEGYPELLLHLIRYAKKFVIHTDEKAEIYRFFSDYQKSVGSSLSFSITDPYAEELAVYERARAIKVDARLVITVTIFVVSLFLLYFSMKSNAVKKIQDIAVYRLLGIKKRSILQIFAIETILLTSFTSLPAVLLTSGVLKFIASIPSLESELVYPWGAAFAILAFLYLVNILAGILPIFKILRLPPAKLAAKYDL